MEEMQFIKGAETILSDVFGKVQLTKGIVHLDIWYDNMNIGGNGITFFDFDNCGNGWLILDIGYYCMHLFYIETHYKVRKKCARSAQEVRKKPTTMIAKRLVISRS